MNKYDIRCEIVNGLSMPVIVLSIHLHWFDQIVSGEKTIELRKTVPDIQGPIKVLMNVTGEDGGIRGEFICEDFFPIYDFDCFEEKTCVSANDMSKYADGNKIYGWGISDAKSYKEKMTLESVGIKRAPQSWQYLREIGKNEVKS